MEFSEITLPGSLPNDPVLTNLWMFDPDDPYNNNNDPHNQVWRNEEISVNDCFMKNFNKYKYIINKDMDEMIVPLKDHWRIRARRFQTIDWVHPYRMCHITT